MRRMEGPRMDQFFDTKEALEYIGGLSSFILEKYAEAFNPKTNLVDADSNKNLSTRLVLQLTIFDEEGTFSASGNDLEEAMLKLANVVHSTRNGKHN